MRTSRTDRARAVRLGLLVVVAGLALVTPHVEPTGALLTSRVEHRALVRTQPSAQWPAEEPPPGRAPAPTDLPATDASPPGAPVGPPTSGPGTSPTPPPGASPTASPGATPPPASAVTRPAAPPRAPGAPGPDAPGAPRS